VTAVLDRCPPVGGRVSGACGGNAAWFDDGSHQRRRSPSRFQICSRSFSVFAAAAAAEAAAAASDEVLRLVSPEEMLIDFRTPTRGVSMLSCRLTFIITAPKQLSEIATRSTP